MADAPPIGTIMAYGGDATSVQNFIALSATGWLPCTGQTLGINIPTYHALYEVIGGTFGHDNLNFTLPDLRGYFVQGAGTAGDQAAVGLVLATSMTGQPINAFATMPIADHTHQISGIPTDTQVIDVAAGVDLAENNDSSTGSSTAGSHSHAILSGGDNESRPVNINVDYIIRYQ